MLFNLDLFTVFALSYENIFCMWLELPSVSRGLLSVLACMATAHLMCNYVFCVGMLLFSDDGGVRNLSLYAEASIRYQFFCPLHAIIFSHSFLLFFKVSLCQQEKYSYMSLLLKRKLNIYIS